MTHKQAFSDYVALRALAGGHPHDAGEVLEEIANDLLREPGTKQAIKYLKELVELFYVRGGPRGDSLHDYPEAREIFVRHHLIEAGYE